MGLGLPAHESPFFGTMYTLSDYATWRSMAWPFLEARLFNLMVSLFVQKVYLEPTVRLTLVTAVGLFRRTIQYQT